MVVDRTRRDGRRRRRAEGHDRVVARVADRPITLTDIRAARELGVIDAPAGTAGDDRALAKMIERQLALIELLRFPLPEPEAGSVDIEVTRMTDFAARGWPNQSGQRHRRQAVAGIRARYAAHSRLSRRAFARRRSATGRPADLLSGAPGRIQGKRRDVPFEEAVPAARAAAAEAGRRVRIARSIDNLRARIDVEVPNIK